MIELFWRAIVVVRTLKSQWPVTRTAYEQEKKKCLVKWFSYAVPRTCASSNNFTRKQSDFDMTIAKMAQPDSTR
jgi:hypothetical protein